MVDLVILSSSPTRSFATPARHSAASSPGLPSLGSLLDNKPGIRAADPVLSFRDKSAIGDPCKDVGVDWSSGEVRVTKPTGNATAVYTIVPSKAIHPTRDEAAGHHSKNAKRSGKLKASTAKGEQDDHGCKPAPEPKTTRKPRVKKVVEDGQTKIPKNRVTKSTMGTKSTGKTSSMEAIDLEPTKRFNVMESEKSSHYFNTPFAASIMDDTNTIRQSSEYNPEMAVRRRLSWTPPPDSLCNSIELTPSSMEIQSQGLETVLQTRNFKDLFADYGLSMDGGANKVERVEASMATMRKRKLVELVKNNVPPIAELVLKPKAGKKKVRTLTDLATSKYAVVEEDQPASVTQYFSLQDSESTGAFKKPAKSRSKGAMKKGAKEVISALLSPESALKQARNQEFVFGTSSQLVRETSPSLLRDLQEAMRASNEVDHYSSVESFSVVRSSGSSGLSATRSLWSAGSRGEDGELMEIETIDLSVTPEPTRATKSSPMLHGPASDDFIDFEAEDAGVPRTTEEPLPFQVQPGAMVEQDIPPASRFTILSAQPLGPIEAAIRDSLLHSQPIMKPADSPKIKRVPADGARKKKLAEKPDYASYTVAQLANEIKSYHFKPVKSKTGMIALLEKCWEGRQKVALAKLDTNAIMQKSPGKQKAQTTSTNDSDRPKDVSAEFAPNAFPAKRGRGRPKKNAEMVSSTQASPMKSQRRIAELSDSDAPLSKRRTSKKTAKQSKTLPEEISDSDTGVTASPPRRRASLIGTPPLPLSLSQDGPASPVLSPEEQQKLLHKHITRAIKSAPRSTNPKEPSWHEKILLYDPIVLEDLAVWLNTGGLQGIGWDEEVTPYEVKQWCIQGSVCCLWKENLRGGARARY